MQRPRSGGAVQELVVGVERSGAEKARRAVEKVLDGDGAERTADMGAAVSVRGSATPCSDGRSSGRTAR